MATAETMQPKVLRAGGSEIRFRPIAEADLPVLLRIYAGTREEELAQVAWEPGHQEAFLAQQFAAQNRWYQENYAGAEFLLILRDGAPVGRLYLVRWDREIRLIDIALLPAHRNAGLGGAILAAILAEGDACGKPVSIHVERYNPALRLYERLGFAPIEDKGVYLLLQRPPAGGPR